MGNLRDIQLLRVDHDMSSRGPANFGSWILIRMLAFGFGGFESNEMLFVEAQLLVSNTESPIFVVENKGEKNDSRGQEMQPCGGKEYEMTVLEIIGST